MNFVTTTLCTILLSTNLFALLYYHKRCLRVYFYYFLLHLPIISVQVCFIYLYSSGARIGLHSVEPDVLNFAILFIILKLFVILVISFYGPKRHSLRNNRANKLPTIQYVKTVNSASVFILVALISLFLLFVFLGIETVINDTRPAVKSGSMFLIILIYTLTYPAFVNLHSKTYFNFFDILTLLGSIVVLALLSKMHALALLISLLIIVTSRSKKLSVFSISISWVIISAAFLYLQAIKDTADTNYGENFFLLLKLIYEYGNESFLGLYSAISSNDTRGISWEINFGIYPLLDGFVKVIPAPLRPSILNELHYFDGAYHLRQSIVASLDEEFYRSFSLMGAFINGVIISLVLNVIDINLRDGKLSPISFSLLLVLPFMIRGPSVVVINHLLFMGLLATLLQFLIVKDKHP